MRAVCPMCGTVLQPNPAYPSFFYCAQHPLAWFHLNYIKAHNIEKDLRKWLN